MRSPSHSGPRRTESRPKERSTRRGCPISWRGFSRRSRNRRSSSLTASMSCRPRRASSWRALAGPSARRRRPTAAPCARRSPPPSKSSRRRRNGHGRGSRRALKESASSSPSSASGAPRWCASSRASCTPATTSRGRRARHCRSTSRSAGRSPRIRWWMAHSHCSSSLSRRSSSRAQVTWSARPSWAAPTRSLRSALHSMCACAAMRTTPCRLPS